MKLDFYKTPLKCDIDAGWVYDSEDNFMFQFEECVPDNIIGEIIYYLNRDEPASKNNFKLHPEDPTVIQMKICSEEWVDGITIRGLGNLTGAGAHNMPYSRAIQIQDNLAKWLLYKLNAQN